MTSFIRDINAYWGTPSGNVGAAPGDMNLPFTAELQYVNPETATTVQAFLDLPPGFTLYDGTNQTYASASGSITSGSFFQLTFNGIFISQSVAVGTYNFTLQLSVFTSSGFYFNQTMIVPARVEGMPDLQFGTSSPSLVSGEVNEASLTVTNSGSGNASQIELTVSANGATVLTPVLRIQNLTVGQTSPVQVELFVPSSGTGAAVSLSIASTYNDPYGVQQSATQVVGFYVTAPSSYPLNYQSEDVSLTPGGTNTVPITITNDEAGPVYQIHTQVSSSSQVSILTQLPVISELAANASVTEPLDVFVSASLANSPLSLTFSYSFSNAQGLTSSYTQSVGLYTTGTNSTSSPSVSISSVQSVVKVGTESEVIFAVKNVGSTSLQSPVFSLTVSSPLIVIENSSYTITGAIPPGGSVPYEALVGSSTSASPGFYSASVTVSYSGPSGSAEASTLQTALTLAGDIDLIIQSPSVTQSSGSLSISGEILNEGFSSAYYANVNGSIVGVKGTSQSDYVGEIDPNTPVPFSFTVSYTPQSSARSVSISIDITFKDSLGLQGTYSAPVQTTLTTTSTSTGTSTATSTSGVGLFTYVEIGVIAALVILAAVGYVYIRRNRASYPAPYSEQKEDRGVI